MDDKKAKQGFPSNVPKTKENEKSKEMEKSQNLRKLEVGIMANLKNNSRSEEKAKILLNEAIKYEHEENFLKAIRFYQEATRLSPNILNIYVNENTSANI